ncbi:uncharacterized protein LOC119085084 [Bradysia coprophila]|uniref:uncharacterized protein LOC119085084 n=1 Tax=Bradysia coprophila TaxID=38358 RepID=UPI00187D95D2|nr:uncharacterized protein LOC119085084 [Bradysia coprophila]
MDVQCSVGIFFIFVTILPSSTGINCFKCRSDLDCFLHRNFQNETRHKDAQFIDLHCSFHPNYIPACKFVIDRKLVVHERSCGIPGVTSQQSFCRNLYRDVIECYCTTDWCNGMDPSNSATLTAEEHFRRQALYEQMENNVINGAVNRTLSVFWMVLLLLSKLICS